jgi:hypothetical protein
MRYFLPILLFSFLSCEPTPVKELEVPDIVKNAFAQKYPNEKKAKWNIDRNDNFEAKFKEGGETFKADFTPDGIWIETETSLKKKDLPQAVKKAIEEQYKDVKIVEIERTDHYQKGLFYDVEFKEDGKKFDIEFNAEGVIIGREN